MSLSQETSTKQSPWARCPLVLGRMSGPGPRRAAWPALHDRSPVPVSWATWDGCTTRGLHVWARVLSGVSREWTASVVWGPGRSLSPWEWEKPLPPGHSAEGSPDICCGALVHADGSPGNNVT